MKKVKVINGYILTAHTVKEQRDWHVDPYGVIAQDAYTGNMALDFGCFDFDDCGTIEEAADHAKSL